VTFVDTFRGEEKTIFFEFEVLVLRNGPKLGMGEDWERVFFGRKNKRK